LNRLPINDLSRHNGPLDAALRVAIDRVLARGHYILGPETQAFEQEFARYLDVETAIGVGNGTDALELALRTAGVGSGDDVVTVANAGMYAGTAIRAVGATPRYIDIEPAHMLLDPAHLPHAVTPATRAIVVTHLYGRMADIESVLAFARPRGLIVIEDCAQAHGALRDGKRAGAWGDLAAFSFYPTKNLGALGDGGMVVVNDASLVERARAIRQYGWGSKYQVVHAGGRNSRLDEIQAAVLCAKLPRLDSWNARRQEIARRYIAGLADCGWGLPAQPDESDVAHLFVVRTPNRDAVRVALAEAGIATDVHYPLPDYCQPAYPGAPDALLPVTRDCSAQILTLPCFPEMSDDEVAAVIDACRQAALEQQT
jgi:dTDP-3-amino-2,3,6-trideoxy-4-keto-D-glucose/dTDP-3-amino-3,4,6-trideoxy-alpha-D-glucose/dTDP-2,6-dideoxy-D-kanosamine transaminase